MPIVIHVNKMRCGFHGIAAAQQQNSYTNIVCRGTAPAGEFPNIYHVKSQSKTIKQYYCTICCWQK